MTFSLTSTFAGISLRIVLQTVALMSSEFSVSPSGEERRLVSSGNASFATEKKANRSYVEHHIYVPLAHDSKLKPKLQKRDTV